MKAIPRSTSVHEQLVAVRLYRDDLERIVGLLRDAGLDTLVADSSFRYDSFDELQKVQGKSPGHLTIEGKEPESHDSVSISKSGQFWYVSSSGDKHHALAREIEGLLRARQSAVEHLPLHWMFQSDIFLFLIGTLIRLRSASVSSTFIAVATVVFLGTLVLTTYWRLYAKVVLNYRHEAGFLARNRDAILLLLLGAVIGVVVRSLFSLFSGASSVVAP